MTKYSLYRLHLDKLHDLPPPPLKKLNGSRRFGKVARIALAEGDRPPVAAPMCMLCVCHTTSIQKLYCLHLFHEAVPPGPDLGRPDREGPEPF